MSKSIATGDKVMVHMASNTGFGIYEFEAVINHTPCDIGDSYYMTAWFGVDRIEKEITINPNSSEFIGLTLIKKHDEIQF